MTDHPITFEIRTNPIVYGGGHTFDAQNMNRGVAYKQNGYFVCMYGHSSGLRGIAPGICFTEKAEGDIKGWVTNKFGAHEIRTMKNRPGWCAQRVWRPGIDGRDNVLSTLVPDVPTMTEAGVSLSLLLSRFNDIARCIQLDERNLAAFGHQLRELLILACTEVEASLRILLSSADTSITSETRLSTRDYHRLCQPLFLKEFSIELRHYQHLGRFRPFVDWDASKPTQSLQWYEAYNSVKHDRANSLHLASLRHCIDAVAAVTAVYCAQYSIPMGGDWGHDAAFKLNDWFRVELIEPDSATFYVPPIQVPSNQTPDLWMFDGRNTDSWNPQKLILN